MQQEQINEIDENTGDQDYLDAIKELKENSVPKADFDKLKEKNKELLQMVVNGETLPAEENPENIEDKKARLRKELFSENVSLNNLEFVGKTIELRDTILEDEGEDIFLPPNATAADKEAVDRVVGIYKDCIEKANGDSGVFTSLIASKIPNDIIKKGR